MTDTRVSLVRCDDYRPELVYQKVKEAVDLVGTMSAYVSPGERVLLKPNLLSPKAPETGALTHPEPDGNPAGNTHGHRDCELHPYANSTFLASVPAPARGRAGRTVREEEICGITPSERRRCGRTKAENGIQRRGAQARRAVGKEVTRPN